jgi:hypothetical protein
MFRSSATGRRRGRIFPEALGLRQPHHPGGCLAIPAGDVCVEFPSVPPLVAARRGAAIMPQLALGQALVTVCALPPLRGRHIAAWYPAGPAQPAPATAAVLDTLAQAGQAPRQAP